MTTDNNNTAELADQLDALGIVPPSQCSECLDNDDLDMCITHAVMLEQRQVARLARDYEDAMAAGWEPYHAPIATGWANFAARACVLDTYRAAFAAGVIDHARLGWDQATAHALNVPVVYARPAMSWGAEALAAYRTAANATDRWGV